MKNFEEEYSFLKREAIQYIDEVIEVDIEEIIKNDTMANPETVEDFRRVYQRIVDFLIIVKGCSIRFHPANHVKKIEGDLANIHSLVKALNEKANKANIINRYLTNLKSSYDNLFQNASTLISFNNQYLVYQKGLNQQKEKIESDLKQYDEKYRKDLDLLKGDATEILNSLNSTKTEVDKFPEIIFAAKHSNYFKEESGKYEEAAKTWLKYTYIASSILLIVAIALFFIPLTFPEAFTDIDGLNTLNFTFSKLIILSILFYGVSLFYRNFKANMHNKVANLNKHIALFSFEAFVKAADKDEATKNAVILETTKMIFSPISTGYLSGDGEKIPTTQFVEIIKNSQS